MGTDGRLSDDTAPEPASRKFPFYVALDTHHLARFWIQTLLSLNTFSNWEPFAHSHGPLNPFQYGWGDGLINFV